MFNNYFIFKKNLKKKNLKKKNLYFYNFKHNFSFKKLDISLPTHFFLNFKIKSVITPFYY